MLDREQFELPRMRAPMCTHMLPATETEARVRMYVDALDFGVVHFTPPFRAMEACPCECASAGVTCPHSPRVVEGASDGSVGHGDVTIKSSLLTQCWSLSPGVPGSLEVGVATSVVAWNPRSA